MTFQIEFESNSQISEITSMEVDGPDKDAWESAYRSQIRARELGKIAELISNLRSNASVSESTGKLSHDYTPKGFQWRIISRQSDLNESSENLEKSTEWIF